MTDGTTTWSYTYDANGMRTSRTNGTKTYNYVYNGSQLTQMTVGNDTLFFTYGALGPNSVTWNGTTYYYSLNAQGDVVGIFDDDGKCLVSYNWDNAWDYNPVPEGRLAGTRHYSSLMSKGIHNFTKAATLVSCKGGRKF